MFTFLNSSAVFHLSGDRHMQQYDHCLFNLWKSWPNLSA